MKRVRAYSPVDVRSLTCRLSVWDDEIINDESTNNDGNANPIESAEQRESNQPAPDSAPVVDQGGDDYVPPANSGEDVAPSTETGVVGSQELDGLDQSNILDDESGVTTRGVQQDAYKQEKEIDEAVPDLE
ncbi:hypothetical protein [Phaffia rhodozyma]|uniref:Uncharacterized protein n=1 Tax=Phaffia rhodozyma TaxID=264483 RepID=A0A0F7SV79_PHARH|nr:hypothetical protein [Phaffia rhodozyma]